ncbi:MAG: hypothetical protein K8S62_10015 [Candidatus Sabulitectum sp.]|nr:hypothetical protein [Candidatus Sabulitectum sp.]
MKTEHLRFLIILSLLLITSCDSESLQSSQATPNNLPLYQLSVADSFGVEIGDSLNMIGSINGYFSFSDGSIVLLDAVARKIRIVQENGNASCYGSTGGGPGEMASPKSMCVMPDGRILVADDYKCLVMEYDISGRYLGNYLESEWKIPEHFLPIDSNSLVGVVFDVEFCDGEIEGFNFYVGRFDSSPEPSVRYIEVRRGMSDPSLYTQIDILDFEVDPNGLVYIVPDHTDYIINVLSSDGTVQRQICPEVDRLAKTGEELAIELSEFEENHIWDSAYTGGYEPLPYHKLITLVGVDADRNLWVQRMDAKDKFTFDVWNLSGDLQFRASLEKFTSNPDLEFHADENGILGAITDSDVHSRVYRLEMLEQSN